MGMECPNCKLVNPPNAVTCDCGYDFTAGALVSAPKGRQDIRKKKAVVWKLVLGGFILLVPLANSSQLPKLAPDDLAGALGRLTGVLVMVVLGAWLIASGLPRTIGLDKPQRRVRRNIWYTLVGIGLLVMIAAAALLAYLGLFAVAVLVTWLYWFGWTWIAWLMADRRAIKRLDLM